MTPARYQQVNEQDQPLTDAEVKAGWHFCGEWDDLLVGPEMGELAVCACELPPAGIKAREFERRMADLHEKSADTRGDVDLEAKPTDPEWRMTEESNGHRWGHWKTDPFECCRVCGIVRRADDQNKPCHGPSRIELRSSSAPPRT